MGSKRYKPTRYYMYNRIQDFFNTNNCISGNCLLIGDTLNGKGSNTAITDMLPDGCTFVIPDYPEVDIQDMPYENNTFDYVIADQVLEHVCKPWIAVEEVRRVLKDSGWAIITSCLMNQLHGIPEDYFRFTPDGLKVLFENFSYIEQAEGHGNLNLIFNYLNGKYKKPVIPGTSLEKEVIFNDKKNLYLVWIIARK